MGAMRRLLAVVSLLLPAVRAQEQAAPVRPNVVIVTIDDCSPDFGCYGNALVATPRLDALAAQGQRFERCFVTTPVCSPVRSSLITGCYATTIGQHQHRSSQPLPDGVRTLPELFRGAGYRATFLPWQRQSPEQFVANAPVEAGRFATVTGQDKTDFNFARAGGPKPFDAWDPVAKDAPFFALIDFPSPKTPATKAHRVAQLRSRTIDPASVPLAPYWCDTVAVREVVASYHEGLELFDLEVGRLMDWLVGQGLAQRTLVFVWGDHGHSFLRAKQWCYDTGLRVPLLVAGPGVQPGVRGELVSSIDLAATALTACGIAVPANMEGRDFLRPDAAPRQLVFASRDRCDETEDRVRAVRDARYKLIWNLRPELPWLGRNDYTRQTFPSEGALLQRRGDPTLTAAQRALLADHKPAWELYDTATDPWELHNLADDAAHEAELRRLRGELEAWVARTDAANPFPEPLLRVLPDAVRAQVSEQRYLHGADQAMPRVLLIGDSISIGYTPFVRELLAGVAVVHHNPGNAGHTGRGLEQLDAWLGDGHWDVIHCNWGLWDLAYRPGGSKTDGLDKQSGTISWTPEQYEQHLRRLMARLQRTSAKLIWASTTPVPEGEPGRFPADAARYNEVAARVMQELHVPIDDLFAHAAPRLAELQQPRNVHFTAAGYRYLAEQVARSIAAALQ